MNTNILGMDKERGATIKTKEDEIEGWKVRQRS